ncbi:exopolysaccharide biosynthesis polyprenyl glycosylphosphotransferase [Prosthecobacter sp.]|uniref:exopolysaccharide biosynthesis polyprenyl glycosylphosphotransferase n=1 Tax=Prosthecobacter sp. TaxID=1965333 RepID=UPI002ABB69A1|nr:exopolysaccharide biosynthesis polyprenyl glycosylphosphotransferase [Prosthecobacter sp.]MDZ4403365.1 exopolysaccharide biosynthesis polyprenyl glycosylphosphotransferase [Prosthecobacter sp.]
MNSTNSTASILSAGSTLQALEARRAWRENEQVSPHFWVLISILGDLVMAVLAAYAAYWLRFHSIIRDFGNFDAMTFRQYGGHMALGSLTLVLVLGWQDVYHQNVLLRSRWVASKIAKGILVWTAGFLAITLALKLQPSISRVYVMLNGATALLLILGWRSVFMHCLRAPGRIEALQQRTLFVGWNAEAVSLWKTLKRDRACAFDLLGWVNTGSSEDGGPADESLPCLGELNDVEHLISTQAVDMVVVADLHGPREQMIALANLCEREMIQFKVIPSCFRVFVSGLTLETIAGTPVLGVTRLPLDDTLNVMVKRALDIVGAVIGLVLSAPVIAIFSAMVWLESPGAVFYRQRRWGCNGVPFEIIKIRSMKIDAENASGAQWCVKDDPRRLRIGAFMRKWNIDELPQFWNVLKGEMSLVGPRPERPELIAGFKHQIPHYNARHHAKPGMTGWAQVNGLRGDTDLSERIQCDLWYLENWSLWLDLQVMLLTFFKRDNAY